MTPKNNNPANGPKVDKIISNAMLTINHLKEKQVIDDINNLIEKEVLVFYDQQPYLNKTEDHFRLELKGACKLTTTYKIDKMMSENRSLLERVKELEADVSLQKTVCSLREVQLTQEKEAAQKLVEALEKCKNEYWNLSYSGSGNIAALSINDFDKLIDEALAEYSERNKK